MPATAKAQPTNAASIVIPNDGNKIQDVKKVFVVVAVVLGVAVAG
jgi:hypothetical protein